MSYLYLKKDIEFKKAKKVIKNKPMSIERKKGLALIMFSVGSFLLLSALVPIVSFSLKHSRNLNQIISPLSNSFYNQDTVLGQADVDYTHLQNWFVDKSNDSNGQGSNLVSSNPLVYSLSIPKLKIDNAQVVIGGEDLKKSLIHYPNTALPGQLGSGVIFGHSVLPQFFNPKSYITIFSTLFKLNQGYEIFVNYDNINYKYIVEQMYEVTPSDLTVLQHLGLELKSVLINGGQVYQAVKYEGEYKITFVDSYKLISIPLSSFAKTFALKSGKQDYMAYSYYTPETIKDRLVSIDEYVNCLTKKFSLDANYGNKTDCEINKGAISRSLN